MYTVHAYTIDNINLIDLIHCSKVVLFSAHFILNLMSKRPPLVHISREFIFHKFRIYYKFISYLCLYEVISDLMIDWISLNAITTYFFVKYSLVLDTFYVDL